MKQNIRLVLKVFDALPLYGLLFNDNGTIKTANKAFLNAVGIERSEVEGMSLDELEPFYTGLQEQFASMGGMGASTFRGQLVNKAGDAILVEQTLVYVEDHGSELIASIGHDISGSIEDREKKYEQELELQKAQARLKAATRLRSEFLANMNHEIRTPMNAIIGYAEMLDDLDIGEQGHRFVKTIRKNGATLLSILNDVMELAKLEAGRVSILKSTTSIKPILDQVVELFSEQIQSKSLVFSYDIQPDLPEYYVLDENHCRQVLTNLLSNAVKFTHRGKVSLSVSGRMDGEQYELRFTVTDTGVGISVEEQQSIFTLLDNPARESSGHGGKRFGLTLCARLAQMMGGGIDLESKRGEGSTFVFYLPVKLVEKNQVAGAGENAPEASAQPARVDQVPAVLVVDDMPVMANLIRAYFSKSSAVEILVAENEEDCLKLANSRVPQLILMDLNLAGADGREVTMKLKEDERTAGIPVVVMTGLMLDKQDYQPLFNDFLAKPFHLKELQRIVDQFISIPKKTVAAPLPSVKTSQESDISGILDQWTGELASLLRQSQLNGSLDTALELGNRMFEQGKETGNDHLKDLGKQLRQHAVTPDILGVEQLLGLLEKVAGEGT